MIKTLFNNRWLQYYIPISLTLFNLITEKRAVITDGGYDRLYGFPFAYISNNNGCTGCYIVFVGALLADLFIYFIFILLIFKGIERIGLRLKTHWIPTVIGLLISVMWAWFFSLTTQDSSFKIKSDVDYKTTHTEFVFDQLPL